MNDHTHGALNNAVDHLSISSTILDQLGDLFAGIKKLAETDPNGSASIAGMAGLGQYVAQDWANTIDVQREITEAATEARS
jgi:hypothetical protein